VALGGKSENEKQRESKGTLQVLSTVIGKLGKFTLLAQQQQRLERTDAKDGVALKKQ